MSHNEDCDGEDGLGNECGGEERDERTNDNATKSIVKRRKQVTKTKTRDSEHEERLTKVKERTLTEARLEYPLSA